MWVRWALAGLALVCVGCELSLEVAVAFDRDGSGRLEVALAADEELRAQADAAGADPLGDLARTGQELVAGWRVTDTTDEEGRRTVGLSAAFTGPEDFERLAAEVAQTLAAPEVDLLGPLTVTLEEQRLVVDGTAGLQPTAAVAELGLTPDQAVTLLREEGVFTYRVRMTLPGAVLDSSADAEDDRTLRWTVDPGEQVAISAVGERPGPPVWPLVAGAATGTAFAALVLRRLVVVRRRAR